MYRKRQQSWKGLSPVRDLLRTKWAVRGIKLGSLVKGAVIEDDWGIKKRSTFFLKSIFWENPSGLPYGNPPPFTREAVFRKKMDEEFESLQTNSYIQKEKAQRKNPCAFSGAEGETRRVFNPSCSLCEQFILCPFLLRKKMDEEFESLSPFCIIEKKGTGKIPIPFLAQKERLELSRRLPDLRP